jgi:hypothetical protein
MATSHSPTADATRFTGLARTSPAANTPGTLRRLQQNLDLETARLTEGQQ